MRWLYKRFPVYGVAHFLANLGWVDFDLGCSTIFPCGSASYARFPSAQVEPGLGGTDKIKVNQTQVRQEMCHPVFYMLFERDIYIFSKLDDTTVGNRVEIPDFVAGLEGDLAVAPRGEVKLCHGHEVLAGAPHPFAVLKFRPKSHWHNQGSSISNVNAIGSSYPHPQGNKQWKI